MEYYGRSPEYDREVGRAIVEFFGHPLDELSAEESNEETERLFFEWFVYDFKLDGGRTPLAEYEFKNPDQLSELKLRETLELGNSHYGLFEVMTVRKGLGLDLRDPFTNETVAVVEHLGTYGLKRNDLICARICQLGQRFEMVGGLLNKLPLRLSDSVRTAWQGQKSFITSPKQVWQMWYAPRPTPKKSKPDGQLEFIGSLYEARAFLDKTLAKNELDTMVNSETVEEWITKRTPRGKELAPLAMLTGLLPERTNKRDTEMLLDAYYALYSVTPRNALNGLSPREKTARSNQPLGSKGLTLHEMKIPPEGGFGKIEEAHVAMQATEYMKAAALFNEAFASYQKNNTTFREVYRFYANAATAYFADGDTCNGLALLNIAIELNPNYDFALNLKKRYENGELTFMILQGRAAAYGKKRRPRNKISSSAAIKYFKFLKEWKINFTTKKKTTSVLTYWSSTPGQPIDRNKPCPCGAKTKAGQPIKFKKCHSKGE